MKKSIFTFFIFTLFGSILSSCSIAKKGGCDCPGMTSKKIELIKIDLR